MRDMRTNHSIYSDGFQPAMRESETEYFTRMAREHASNQRRERRQRVMRKLIRRGPRGRAA
jgi:hypothetical protein